MSDDTFRLDSHKLMYHPDRVGEWMARGDIYPIYMEISPSGACNHRCAFCGVDYLGYQTRFLPAQPFVERLAEMGRLGVRSVMFCGEGEPLLHKDIVSIVTAARKSGIDAAMTTNGTLLDEQKAEGILGALEWIKVSVNAGTAESYQTINGAKKGDFDTVLDNLARAHDIRKRNGYSVTLGMQMILLPENRHEAVTLARIARDIGMDYLVIKPYSHNPSSLTTRYKGVTYEDATLLAEELEPMNGDGFSVIFRHNAMEKAEVMGKPYPRCLALPYWAYVDAGGGVWGCLDFIGDDRFYYGNLLERSFADIWNGERRAKALDHIENAFDLSVCRSQCRMDEVNRYLWSLKSPPPHHNFI